jgi:hypothetical protein
MVQVKGKLFIGREDAYFSQKDGSLEMTKIDDRGLRLE